MQVPCRDWATGIQESTSAPTNTTRSDDRYGKYHAVPQRVPSRSGGGERVDGGHFLTSELENLQALLIASARLRCNWAMGNRVSASRLSVANLAPAGHAIVGDFSEIAGATLAVEND